jgi:regulator of sirC expression with transglutaminase-like and TPR domain
MRAASDRARAFKANPHRTELDAALFVAGLVAEDVDAALVRATFDALASDVELADAADLVRRVGDLGFTAADDYYALDNSRIDRVLATRRGIPITLAVVYVEFGRRGGLDVHGVGFPGHFLVEVGGTLVDPFHHRVLSDAAFAVLAARHPGVDVAHLRARATSDDIALRMINNVKGVLLGLTGDAAVGDVFGLIDAQLALGADPTALHLERAELWRRLRSVPGIRAALEDARASCADATLAKEIERRLAALPKPGGGPLH